MLKASQVSQSINLGRLRHRFWALNAFQWGYVEGMGMANKPDIPISELEKLDKGGALVKALAMIQIIYLVIQLIARNIAGLPSSQLEIATLAFAVSSITTYALYWSRPQGVDTIRIFQAKPRREWPDSNMSREMILSTLAMFGPTYLWLGYRGDDVIEPDLGPVPIPNDASNVMRNRKIRKSSMRMFLKGFGSVYGGSIIGAIYGGDITGALHLLAQNFEFPTQVEQRLWFICAVLMIALPFIGCVPLAFWTAASEPLHGRRSRTIVGGIIIVGFIVPYVLVRLTVFVEVFRTLFYLPPEAYIETWSGSFPKWG